MLQNEDELQGFVSKFTSQTRRERQRTCAGHEHGRARRAHQSSCQARHRGPRRGRWTSWMFASSAAEPQPRGPPAQSPIHVTKVHAGSENPKWWGLEESRARTVTGITMVEGEGERACEELGRATRALRLRRTKARKRVRETLARALPRRRFRATLLSHRLDQYWMAWLPVMV